MAHCEAERVDDGVESGEKQQMSDRQQLVRGQRASLEIAADDMAHHVVAWFRLAGLNKFSQKSDNLATDFSLFGCSGIFEILADQRTEFVEAINRQS